MLTIDFLLLRVRICSNACSISIWTTKNTRKWLRCACLVWFFMPLSAVWVKAVKVAHVGPERLWIWQLWWQAWILGEQVVMGWMLEHRSRSSANMKYFLFCGVWRSVIIASDNFGIIHFDTVYTDHVTVTVLGRWQLILLTIWRHFYWQWFSLLGHI